VLIKSGKIGMKKEEIKLKVARERRIEERTLGRDNRQRKECCWTYCFSFLIF
jgi:hypothetical protein